MNATYASEESLNNFFEHTATLKADFVQIIVDELGQVMEESKGEFYLSRPGKFRWDYLDDSGELTQQIIADGDSIYFYDPELEQLSVRGNEEAMLQVPSLVLVNSGQALDGFFVVEQLPESAGMSWVSLTPKDGDASYQKLMLAFEEGKLAEIGLFDVLGNETQLRLSHAIENIEIGSQVFVADIPDGTDVLRN